MLAIAAAQTAADAAAVLADGKFETFFEPDPPESAAIGDLWFVTNDGNKLYRRSATEWVVATDAALAQAIRDAAGAQATAEGKVTTFYSTDAPAAASLGDLWYNSATGVLSRWNGAA